MRSKERNRRSKNPFRGGARGAAAPLSGFVSTGFAGRAGSFRLCRKHSYSPSSEKNAVKRAFWTACCVRRSANRLSESSPGGVFFCREACFACAYRAAQSVRRALLSRTAETDVNAAGFGMKIKVDAASRYLPIFSTGCRAPRIAKTKADLTACEKGCAAERRREKRIRRLHPGQRIE